MNKIKVFSIGEISSFTNKINSNILVISFFNSNDFSIIDKQKFSIKTNPSILEFENNILCLQRDDITKLSFFKTIIHKLKPYNNIFSNNDVKLIVKFLKNNDYQNKDIYIQCEYGKSRSLTTAICLEKYFLNKTHKLEHEEKIIRNYIIYNCFQKNRNYL